MPELTTVLVGLDAISALLTLALAAYFLRLWAITREPLHLLFTLGVALVGASFATVSASTFDLGRTPEVFDQLRIAGQVGGVLVLLFAYAGARATGRPRPFVVIGFAITVLLLLFVVLYVAIPPAFTFPTTQIAFIVAHGTMCAGWIVCAVLALAGRAAAIGRERLLVPAAFLAFAVSKYVWLVSDVAEDVSIAPFIYPWRFAGILLMLGAVALPARSGRPEAPTP